MPSPQGREASAVLPGNHLRKAWESRRWSPWCLQTKMGAAGLMISNAQRGPLLRSSFALGCLLVAFEKFGSLSLQLMLRPSNMALEQSKFISTMQAYSAQMGKHLTLNTMAEGLNGTITHLFMKTFLFGYIYHITFYDVLGVSYVIYLKYILGF